MNEANIRETIDFACKNCGEQFLTKNIFLSFDQRKKTGVVKFYIKHFNDMEVTIATRPFNLMGYDEQREVICRAICKMICVRNHGTKSTIWKEWIKTCGYNITQKARNTSSLLRVKKEKVRYWGKCKACGVKFWLCEKDYTFNQSKVHAYGCPKCGSKIDNKVFYKEVY